MDYCTVWFIVEMEEEENHLSAKYDPSHILLCTWSFVLDNYKGKCTKGTHDLHGICSIATAIQICLLHKQLVKISNLPCNCQHRNKDPDNGRCIYAAWGCTRSVDMWISCVGHDKVESWMGHMVAKDISSVLYYGIIVKYNSEEKNWQVKFDGDGGADLCNYTELSEKK